MTPTNNETCSKELSGLNGIALIADDTSRTSVYIYKKINQYKIKKYEKDNIILLDKNISAIRDA